MTERSHFFYLFETFSSLWFWNHQVKNYWAIVLHVNDVIHSYMTGKANKMYYWEDTFALSIKCRQWPNIPHIIHWKQIAYRRQFEENDVAIHKLPQRLPNITKIAWSKIVPFDLFLLYDKHFPNQLNCVAGEYFQNVL